MRGWIYPQERLCAVTGAKMEIDEHWKHDHIWGIGPFKDVCSDNRDVDNSRLFVDKWVALWRSPQCGLFSPCCHPPYMGDAFSSRRYIEKDKSIDFLWMGCGLILLNPSTGWKMRFGQNQPHIQREAGEASPYLGVWRNFPQYPHPLLLLRISFILKLLEYKS